MPLDVADRGRALAQTRRPVLSVVVPTYDEADNVLPMLNRLDAALAPISWEVIFADDNSPDGTHARVKQLAESDARVRCLRRVGRRGLAGACIDGILSSSAPYVAVMDGDLQHDEAVLLRMLRRLEDGEGDLAVGTRYSGSGSAGAFTAQRGAISRFANALAQKLLGVRISDPMSGFFMVRREAFEEIAPQLSHEGFKILLDLVATAGPQLAIVEEPYSFRKRELGESKFDLRAALEFIGLLAAKLTDGIIAPRFVPYAVVGAFGLLVHFAVLTALHAGFGFQASQAIATFCAMVTNFSINNRLTYRDLRLRGWAAFRGAALFCLIGGTGFVANIGVATMLYSEQRVWWLAGVAGALMGAVWNFSMSNRIVWRSQAA